MPRTDDQAGAVDPRERARGWPRQRRLRRGADFGAVLAADRARTLRASRELLSMTAVLTPAGPLRSAGLRLGITVGRRQARRAVDRSLVKRIVREAARQVAAGLQRRCEQAGIAVDVVIRLKTEGRTGTTVAALTPWRRQLRAEADALLADLQRRLPAASGEERVDV